MKSNCFILFITLFILASCKQGRLQKTEDVQAEYSDIDTTLYFNMAKNSMLAVDLENPEIIPFFDCFEGIELIPLETTDDVLIAHFSKLLYYKGIYYVFDRQQSIIFMFDEKGRFISKIDKKGQGPKEYLGLEDIQINPFTNKLELMFPFGILYEFDLSGKFIGKEEISSDYLRAVHEFIPLNDHTTVFFAAMRHPFRVVYYDREEKKITGEAYPEHFIMGSMSSENSFSFYKGEWYFFRVFDRHIYKVTNDSIEVAYTWDFGKFNRDAKDIHFTSDSYNNPDRNYAEAKEQVSYWIARTDENNRYIIAHIKFNEIFNVFFFDKKTQRSGIINPFPRPRIVTNTHLLTYCNIGQLETFIKADNLDENNRKIYEELIHGNGDANPVIIKYKFKQEPKE